MQFRKEKIEWLHREWRKNPDRLFQTRRTNDGDLQLVWIDSNSPLRVFSREPFPGGIPTVIRWLSRDSWSIKWRIQWEVLRDYAIQPGRGCYGVKVGRQGELILDPEAVMFDVAHRRLRMLVRDIQEQPLQDITADNCLSEGVVYYPHNPYAPWGSFGLGGGWLTPERAYEAMWDGLKPAKGHRWADNPTVFAISFQLRAM